MPRAPTKIYIASFDNVTEPLRFVRGFEKVGVEIRAQDLTFFPKRPQRLLIRLQNGFIGRRVVNALKGFKLNGQSLYAGGANPDNQIDEVDSRGGFAVNVFIPEAADIQRCVTEAFVEVQPNSKGKGTAMESATADETGTSNDEGGEDNEEDSVEERDDDMAKDQEELQGGDLDEELSEISDSSSGERISDSE